jgi:hypothetical protein
LAGTVETVYNDAVGSCEIVATRALALSGIAMWLNSSRDSSPSSTGRIATMRQEYGRELIPGASPIVDKVEEEDFVASKYH